jgi:hypothetical protein
MAGANNAVLLVRFRKNLVGGARQVCYAIPVAKARR